MWLTFAILYPLLYALVHVLDSYCVEDIFDRPWMGMVTSSVASLVILAPLPFILPLGSWEWTATNIILLALLSGMVTQISQAFYFQSLSYSEAGIVAAYWNMIPALVAIASFAIFREVLHVSQYIGIGVLISASVIFCLIDTRYHTRWKTLGFMFIAASLQATSYLIDEVVFQHLPFFQGFILIILGIILTGMFPLLLKNVRAVFVHGARKIMPAAKLFVAIEIINILAFLSAERAIDLGIPSLVSALETAIPAFTFIVGIMVLVVLPTYGDRRALQKLIPKLGLIGCMIVGIVLLNS